MTFTMIKTGTPITELDIKRLEKKTKTELPHGYREFLLKYNGGHVDPKYYPIQGLYNNPFGEIQLFFGINHPIESCRPDWNHEVFCNRMPIGFFPIAAEGGGNIICLSLKGNTQGGVFYWNHDEETEPPTFANVYKIADSFEQFLESLQYVDISTL